jgi:hypothetical protein
MKVETWRPEISRSGPDGIRSAEDDKPHDRCHGRAITLYEYTNNNSSDKIGVGPFILPKETRNVVHL